MGAKDIMKGGWHPKGKDGGRESWRGDFKGINQVAGWVGHGKSASSGSSTVSRPRPVTSLQDPNRFGRPPVRTGDAASAAVGGPVRSGLGSAINVDEQQDGHDEPDMEESAQASNARPPPPPLPFRANTTGLTTDHLPPPPTRQVNIDETDSTVKLPVTAKPKPKLPPRLPPRGGAAGASSSPAPGAALFTASRTSPPPPPPPYTVRASVPAQPTPPPASQLPASNNMGSISGIARPSQAQASNAIASGMRSLNLGRSAPTSQQASSSSTEHAAPPSLPTPSMNDINRSRSALSKAGVSVPGLGIAPSSTAAKSDTTASPASLQQIRSHSITPSRAATAASAASSLLSSRSPPPVPRHHAHGTVASNGTSVASNAAGGPTSPPPLSSTPSAADVKAAARFANSNPAARDAARGFFRGAIQGVATSDGAKSAAAQQQAKSPPPPPVPMGSKPR